MPEPQPAPTRLSLYNYIMAVLSLYHKLQNCYHLQLIVFLTDHKTEHTGQDFGFMYFLSISYYL